MCRKQVFFRVLANVFDWVCIRIILAFHSSAQIEEPVWVFFCRLGPDTATGPGHTEGANKFAISE